MDVRDKEGRRVAARQWHFRGSLRSTDAEGMGGRFGSLISYISAVAKGREPQKEVKETGAVVQTRSGARSQITSHVAISHGRMTATCSLATHLA